MKGKLEKIGDKWFVRYVRSEGGGSFRLPLHPNFVEMTDFVYIKNVRFYDGDEIEFTEALVNPMGRDVDPNDLGQNHSLCKWYAKPVLKKNFYCGDEVDYGEQCDFQCDRCVDATGVDYGYLPNDDEKSKQEQKQHLIDMMKSDEELGLYDESSPGYNHQARLVNDLAKEIKLEDIFNDEKREKVKQVIHQHKVLKDLTLVNPAHLRMTSNGHGEFPDGYKLTEKGIQYIIEELNKE
jgi:hypothetical protein